MFKEKHYFIVGLFTLIVLVLGGYFVYWLTAAKDPANLKRYRIHFDGSVQGLGRGSSVRYLGVHVGRVQSIALKPSEPGRVEVLIDIAPDTPIRTNTQASVEMQGVTGLAYVSLSETSAPGELIAYPARGIPEIPAGTSRIERLFESAPALSAEVTALARNINRMLSRENLAHLSSMLANLDRASAGLEPAMAELGRVLRETRSTLEQLNAMAASLHQSGQRLAPELEGSLRNIRRTADNLDRLTGQLATLVGENRDSLDRFLGQGLTEFSLLLQEGRLAAREVRDLAESLQRDPTQLIIPSSIERTEIAP